MGTIANETQKIRSTKKGRDQVPTRAVRRNDASAEIPALEDVLPAGKRTTHVTIRPLNLRNATFRIIGTAALCTHKFSEKAREMMIAKQEAGERTRKERKREPRNFAKDYDGAMHVSAEGWAGVPASAFRNALISACRVAGFQMTRAKLSVFVLADGTDRDGVTPLVKITKGKPLPWSKCILPARNDDGSIDLRARPTWEAGWEMCPRIEWDSDQFSEEDIANLLNRAGRQVGICEGRPDSKNSAGLGWGTFMIAPGASPR